MSAVTSEDCPCCDFESSEPELMGVSAFVPGYIAGRMGLAAETVLCPRHLQMANEAMAFASLALSPLTQVNVLEAWRPRRKGGPT